jgi:hypothetical protein
MAGLWRKNPDTPGGKFLVLRRDGTVPEWPWFVVGAADPVAPWALAAYALVAWVMGYDRAYCRDVWNLARVFRVWRRANKTGDPDAPPHRRDDPVTVARMVGTGGS